MFYAYYNKVNYDFTINLDHESAFSRKLVFPLQISTFEIFAVLVTFNYHLVIVLVALKTKSLTFIHIIALDYF